MARYEIQGSKISQLPKKEQLDGTEAFIIEDATGTKQAGAASLKNYIGSGGGTVDQELNSESTNAVANKAVTEELSKLTTEYNVSVFYPDGGTDGTDKYTLETAIVKVPESLRNVGIKCSFLDEGGRLQTWEYLGGAWAAGSFSQVGAAKLSELEYEKVNLNPGKNLLDIDSCIKGFYLYSDGRAVKTDYPYSITPFIETKGNNLVINHSIGNVYAALYDEKFAYIEGSSIELQVGKSKVLRHVEGAVYARFTINETKKLQIEYGDESTDYEEYCPLGKIVVIEKLEKFNHNKVETHFATQNPGKNLFDPQKWVLGEWITPYGIEEVGLGIGRTNYIPIEDGQTLTASSKQSVYQCRAGLFDKEFKFIDGSATESGLQSQLSISITGTSESKYAVFTFRNNDKGSNNMVEIGNTPSAYEPYSPNKETLELKQKVKEFEYKVQDFVKKEVEYNLFDKLKTEDGKFLTNSDDIFSNSDY